MKHVKALIVKAIMIWAILWIVLTGLYGVSFVDSTIVGVIIVVMIYVLGDLLILRKVGNVAATIADAGSAAVILWVYLYFMNDMSNIWMKVLVPALLIGIAEWFFHKWLLNQGIVPDERKLD
ncbi:MAG: DUF2512 family protein [Enterococcus lacertideformus]|uniref:DUF2512 family protein n=1 Tax=Enterococcus lacertideformus TaxID=2771493 RepID=A0A931AYR3_9ENTE|nr:DUF2512 family protein [Enterococcus lacertideformus]